MSFEKFKREVTVHFSNSRGQEDCEHHDDVAWYGYTDNAFEVRVKSDIPTDEKYEDKYYYDKETVVRVVSKWSERYDKTTDPT